MNLNLFTDDVDPDYDDGPRFVKVAPGTPEQQLVALEERKAAIKRWITELECGDDTHSDARYSKLWTQLERICEHTTHLDAVIRVNTPDPEPPDQPDIGDRWYEGDEDRFFTKAGDK